MLNLIIEYAVNFYDALLAVHFVLKFNKSGFKENKLSFIPVVLIFTVSNLFLHFANDTLLLHILIFVVILFGFEFTIKTGSLVVKIISPIIFILTLIITNSVFLILLTGFSSATVIEIWFEYSLYRYMYILMCKIAMTAVLVLLLKTFSINGKIKTADLFLYFISPCVTVLALYSYMLLSLRYDLSEFSGLILGVIAAFIILNVFTIMLFKNTVRNTTARYELEMINSRRETEEQKYTELCDLYERLALTRHDLNDHLLYIENLIAEKRYDEANSYISHRKAEISSSRQIKITGDRLLDYILNCKLSAHKDINVVIKGRIEESRHIEELDLAALYGNILDNAIEATQGCKEKYIELAFSVTGNYRTITCRNTVTSPVLKNNAALVTTKKDKSSHGYGIKSIRRIVDKYSGLLEFSEEDGKFCIQIAIPIKR